MSRKIIRNIEQLKDAFNNISKVVANEPIILNAEKLSNKRTDKQLRSVWFLINTITLYFKENGNNWSADEVMTYFKIKSGLYREIDGCKIPLSISDKAKRTKAEMEKLIDCILEFGAENNIDNCYLDDGELKSILDNYE